MSSRLFRSLVVCLTAGCLLAIVCGCSEDKEGKSGAAPFAKKEAAKTVEPKKVEPKKEAPAKVEKAPAKAEPAKKETPKAEAPKPEAAKKETPKAEAPKPEAAKKEAAKAEAAKLADSAVPPEVKTKLAAADEFDGKVDNIVSKCPACGLAADGKPGSSLQFAGYTMQFCSDKCRDAFAKDTVKSILGMTIPKK